MIETIISCISSGFQAFGNWLNLTFIWALIVAGFGAWIAKRIAYRNKRKDELTSEIRALNAAVSVTSVVLESFTALKRQHVGEMMRRFETERQKFFAMQDSARRGERQKVPEIQFDYLRLSMLRPPLEPLQKLLYEKASPSAKALRLFAALAQSADTLETMIETRNDLIAANKTKPTEIKELAARYFGLRDDNGVVDAEFSTALTAICRSTDNGIWFSRRLFDELQLDLDDLRATFSNSFGEDAPRKVDYSFTSIDEARLMPPDEEFQDWIKNFPLRKPVLLRGRFQRLLTKKFA